MESDKIKKLKTDHDEIMKYLKNQNQIDFAILVGNSYTKSLLMSVASYFESVITSAIGNYSHIVTKDNDMLVSFIYNKGIERQYHTYFNWKDGKSANNFFGLFGGTAKAKAEKLIKDKELDDSVKAFLQIGQERNKLVHQNYIEVNLNTTFDELYDRYIVACAFVGFIKEFLNDSVKAN